MVNQIEIELKDESGIPDFNADIVITEYEIGDWCGNGTALIKCKDRWYLKDLSHCSCYGPWDESCGTDYNIKNSEYKSDPLDFMIYGTTIYDGLLPLLKELDARKLLSSEQTMRLQTFL